VDFEVSQKFATMLENHKLTRFSWEFGAFKGWEGRIEGKKRKKEKRKKKVEGSRK